MPVPGGAATIPGMPPDPRTDAALLGLVADGDRDAYDELYRRYARSVLGVALRRTGDRARAEAATQGAFSTIWRSASHYDPSRIDAASWLYAAGRDAILDGLRRLPDATAGAGPDIPTSTPGARDSPEGEWVTWRVHRALETLPEHERSLVELVYWSGMSASKTAEYLGLPLDAVKTRVRAALGRLADELEDER